MDKRVKTLTRPPRLRLNARTGWPISGELGNLAADDSMFLSFGRSSIPINDAIGSFGGRTLPKGFAISGDGLLFLADPKNRQILVRHASGLASDFVPLWTARPLPETNVHLGGGPIDPLDPYALIHPTDVAVAPNGDLVITDKGYDDPHTPHGKILVVSFPSGALRHVIKKNGSRPESVAFDHLGNAYIADSGLQTILRFNENWVEDTQFLHPQTHFEAPVCVAGIDVSDKGGSTCSCSSTNCNKPSPKHPLLQVIDNNNLKTVLSNGRLSLETTLLDLPLSPPALTQEPGGTLVFYDSRNPGRLPLLIQGLDLTASGLEAQTGLPLIARPQKVSVPRSEQLITSDFDGGKTGFHWDKITLDVKIPKNTRLLLRTLTSDSLIEPDRIPAVPDRRWSAFVEMDPDSYPEFLIGSRPGRYLWVQIEFRGDGINTPIINEIDIYGPRQSSLRLLPSPFHEDLESAIFLDRFLSYFDTVFDEISAQNLAISELFDPKAAPEGEFLNWLGAWFDWRFFSEWSVDTRRDMIADAIPYYKMRGTVPGLRKILQWHTGLKDPLPQIIEHFRLANFEAPVVIGGTELRPTNTAHSFTIALPQSAVPSEAHRIKLEKLINVSIPAHTSFELNIVSPGLSIGSQSTIGVDTMLGSYPNLTLGSTALGEANLRNRPNESLAFKIPSVISKGRIECQKMR